MEYSYYLFDIVSLDFLIFNSSCFIAQQSGSTSRIRGSWTEYSQQQIENYNCLLWRTYHGRQKITISETSSPITIWSSFFFFYSSSIHIINLNYTTSAGLLLLLSLHTWQTMHTFFFFFVSLLIYLSINIIYFIFCLAVIALIDDIW